MKIIFMGTPDFSVPILDEIIAAGHEVVAVYSQPPRAKGRGMKISPTPVAARATDYGIEVRTPHNFKNDEDIAAFCELEADAAIVVAYGLLLPQVILDGTKLGCFNIHASLLPRWRGAAPIQRAIMAGDRQTGVMFMQMEAGLDTGPIGLVDKIDITEDMTAASLHDDLSRLGADLTNRALAALERDSLIFTPQDEEGVTYAQKISKTEAEINWSLPITEVINHIHGLSPFPGAYTHLQENDKLVRLKILAAQKADIDNKTAKPGSILSLEPSLTIACGDGAISLISVQKAGKSRMAVDEFLRGTPLQVGDILA